MDVSHALVIASIFGDLWRLVVTFGLLGLLLGFWWYIAPRLGTF